MRYYSCVVDSQPLYYFQAWNLIHSLMGKGKVKPSHIFVNCTTDVEIFFQDEIQKLGCNLLFIERFGDGKYCNKIAQLDNKVFFDSECVFFLDTDMIVLGDISNLYVPNEICGKIVDFPNPDINLLKRLYDLAGFNSYPYSLPVDCTEDYTFHNNLNGGLYVVPGNLVMSLHEKWKKWALFLMSNIKLLKDVGKQAHVDQISFSMASHELGIKICNLPRKYNYPAHDSIKNSEYPLVLHYHKCMSKSGLIISNGENDRSYQCAIDDANRIISESFNKQIYKSFCKYQFPVL